jgi:hypothetical protein
MAFVAFGKKKGAPAKAVAGKAVPGKPVAGKKDAYPAMKFGKKKPK